MAAINNKYSQTFSIYGGIKRDCDIFLATTNLTYTKIVNALMVAFLMGDITVDTIPEGQNRIYYSISDALKENIGKVTFRDREGRILNPTKYNKEEI